MVVMFVLLSLLVNFAILAVWRETVVEMYLNEEISVYAEILLNDIRRCFLSSWPIVPLSHRRPQTLSLLDLS